MTWFEDSEAETSESEIEEDQDKVKNDASEELVEYLLRLQVRGKIHANDFCVISHWAARAGAVGETLKKAALPPGKASGSYSRHLSRALKLSYPVELYELKCPGHERREIGRVEITILCLPLQELLAKELEDDPAATAKALEEKPLPPNYKDHKVVVSHPDKAVWPLAIYMDGVAVTKRDGLLVVTVRNLATQQRWLVLAVKRSHMCKCGCRGWCTLCSLMRWLRWCLDSSIRIQSHS